jgi:hypothetical protein
VRYFRPSFIGFEFIQTASSSLPLSVNEFEDEIRKPVVDHVINAHEEQIMYRRMSVLFMVLALGSLMDPNHTHHHFGAEKYHQLARGALFVGRALSKPTLHVLQTLVSSPLPVCDNLFVSIGIYSTSW